MTLAEMHDRLGPIGAVRLRKDREWAVRPEGCLGTMGWKDGIWWRAVVVLASTEAEAVRKAGRRVVDVRPPFPGAV